jgi:outer membrane protein OmpA-like peptidoglycan-associated protein
MTSRRFAVSATVSLVVLSMTSQSLAQPAMSIQGLDRPAPIASAPAPSTVPTLRPAYGPAPANYEPTGKRVDNSAVRGEPQLPNQERESAQLSALGGSAVIVEERRTITEAPPTSPPGRQVVTIDARMDNTNFESGSAVLLPHAVDALTQWAESLRGKDKLRFDVSGHTDPQRISERLKPTYPDNQALSEARAKVVVNYLAAKLGLPTGAFSAAGYADTKPIAPNDTLDGWAKNRRTEIKVTYEESKLLPAAPPAPPIITEKVVKRDICAPTPGTDAPFSISIDGQPMGADSAQKEGDRQRCVDVALDKADIQVKYDPLNVAPALNVWAASGPVGRGQQATFRTYTNYAWWLKKAEIRVFVAGQTASDNPVAVLPAPIGGDVTWTPPDVPGGEIGYVLRVYDAEGHFDQTSLKTLQILDHPDPAQTADRMKREALSGYGESSLQVKNIRATGGAVTVSGERVKPGESITVLGMPVPVDDNGKFVFRQILPSGPHKVDVAVRGADGRVAKFERNLSIADQGWFYMAIADLTAGHGKTTGPADLVAVDSNDHYEKTNTVDGRLAFYLKGKIKGQYLLTAAADTQEQPLGDLFSNFTSKDPRYLLRRIDPNRYYPVYGDDSTVVDDAPTQGKFYVRLEGNGSDIMWGNFQTSWTGTELTQYSRGLYGLKSSYQSQATTAQGERRYNLETFVAEPGTLQSREEFRGAGSLYYLRRKDLTEGSERVWIEIRDRDSGVVLQRTELAPSQDYDVDYLQGRLMLRAPLPATADGSSLVKTTSVSGDSVFLVATYEYVPGLTKISGNTVGAKGSAWLTNYLRVGATYYREGEGDLDQELVGGDITLRYKPGTFLRGEVARSQGQGVGTLTSYTGGFDFTENVTTPRQSNAFRLDAALDLHDLSDVLAGRMAAYWQRRDRGFSGPGLMTAGGDPLDQYGIAIVTPLGSRGEIATKISDNQVGPIASQVQELSLRYKLGASWGVSAGVRHDNYQTGTGPTDSLFNASPTLSRNGERTDAVVRVDYRPLAGGQTAEVGAKLRASDTNAAATQRYLSSQTSAYGQTDSSLMPNAVASTPGAISTVTDPTAAAGIAAARLEGVEYQPWNVYGFAQTTLSRSGNREANDRAGAGAGWQVTNRLRVGAEASGGAGGFGGKLNSDYAISDRSTLYLTYASETEVADQNYAGRQAILTAGGRTRLSDRLGIYAESREASGEGPHSLTNGFGVDFAPAKEWTTGLKFETGKLSDPYSGDTLRDAVSMTVGYKNSALKVLTSVEYRRDKSESLGTVDGTCSTGTLSTGVECETAAGNNKRETVLMKNSVSYKADEDWRLLGSLNFSRSSSSEGAFYDGDYTEAVLAAAYRPVANDRLNALFKYTYFYNLPSSGQIGQTSSSILDYTQQSHVLNIDVIYDVAPWLSIGGKYGYRYGKLRDTRSGGDWYDSAASLAVLRADLHLIKSWSAVVELRALKVNEADDLRKGILLAIYRQAGANAKFGVGYNFTDFSDDLTDLSYRHRGVFMNVLATY